MLARRIISAVARRVGRGLPIVRLWAVATILGLAARHAARLDGTERRRLLALLRRGRGRPSRLGPEETAEFRALVTKLEPRLFVGDALDRIAPVPVPARLLYGAKGTPARDAATTRRRDERDARR